MRRIFKSIPKAIPVLAVIYGLYLFKTLLGINLSNQYSADWVFKAPLYPIEASKEKLCQELETVCAARKDLKYNVQKGVNKTKRVFKGA